MNSVRIFKLLSELSEYNDHLQEFEPRFKAAFVHVKYAHELADFISMIVKKQDVSRQALKKIDQIRKEVFAEFSVLAKELKLDQKMQEIFEKHSKEHQQEIQLLYSSKEINPEVLSGIRKVSDLIVQLLPKLRQIVEGQQKVLVDEAKALDELEDELKKSPPDAEQLCRFSLLITDLAKKLNAWLITEKESCFDKLTPLFKSYRTFDDEVSALKGRVSVEEFNHLLAKASAPDDIAKLSFLVAKKNRWLFFWNRFPRNAEELVRQRSAELALSSRSREIGKARLMSFLTKSADRDALTGIWNRGSFEKKIKELTRAGSRKVRFALAILDVDHFKKVNDTLGHQTGDFVLKKIVDVIKTSLRKGDEFFRYGGEEFALVLPMDKNTSVESIISVCQRLRLNVESESKRTEWPLQVTVSIGQAIFPDDAQSATELISAADKAVYSAKHSGRNRVIAFAS